MASKKLILTLACVTALALVATGCGSDDDSSPTAPVVDTAPPALPANLAVAYDQAQDLAVVSWAPNSTITRFAGFPVSCASYNPDAV